MFHNTVLEHHRIIMVAELWSKFCIVFGNVLFDPQYEENLIFAVALCMLIILSSLFDKLTHTNYYKIVKLLNHLKL